MKKFLIAILITLVFQVLSYTQGRSQGDVFQREREALTEDQHLDEETKKEILNRLKILYQPPFHIGLETGLGFTGTNVPDDHSSKPNIGFALGMFGTYYYDDNLAIQFSLGWNAYNGKFSNASSMETEYKLDNLDISVSQLLFYKEGFFYLGPKLSFNLKDKLTVLSGSPAFYETKKVNIGLTIGGGWRIDLLYQLRMHVSLEFNYFFTKWRDAPSEKWKNYSVLIKIGILYGLGSYKP